MTEQTNSPLLAALNAVMKEVGYVKKDKINSFHQYNYAGEEGLLRVLRPAMVKHGILLIPSLDGSPQIDEHGNTHIVASYTLAHISGDRWPEPIRIPGCGNDRAKNGNIGDKGVYKALTGANKYMLFKLFQIATGDDPEVESDHDKESDSPPKATPSGERFGGPLTITELKKTLRALAGQLAECKTMDDVAALETGYADVIGQCIRDLPDWYYGSEQNPRGLQQAIEDKRDQVNDTQGDF